MYDPVWRPIPGTGQNLNITTTVTTSAAVGSQTYAVRLTATGNCHVQFGNATTAAPTVVNLQKETLVKSTDISQVFACSPGDKVYVVQDGAATGNLQLQEMTH